MAASARTFELGRTWWTPGQARRFENAWRLACTKFLGTISAVVIVVFLAVAIAAPFVAPYDPTAVESRVSLQAPSAAHLMGTDELGRDMLSRILFGSRISLFVGLVSVLTGVLIGIALGITSAYFGGRYDLI